ncbi:hypothetical protein LLZ86_00905 [Metamycoplasma hominis]|uniref:hypothetical protein n=1 Tax=Metamycoplasma hominis TaxID=2098 RepID=UPI001F197FFB|nr:hypothetical protein [Metamycoplasma hominis]UIU37905.1 hypothetical protein LLZ86_00905 [Metamycoplasma hominis]
MKKRINILMSISIVCAAASTSAIAAMCSISNNSTKKYNEAKSRLLNLIKKLDNEGQKKANDFIARQDKKFNSTAFKNHSNTSKLIDEIEIFSKKILENLQKDEKQRLEELNKLNKLRLDLQNLINSNDGQNVDSSDAKKALNENQIDDSLPIDKIKKTNENLENAKKELLNKINTEKELQSKIFNDKKQELKRVLDLEDAKEVDSIKEQKVYIETNISETSSIEDIKNKIIEVEKATSSLTSKILNTKQQELQEFENIKKDLQDFINTKLNDAKYQSIKQKALDKINNLNGINKDSTIKEIKAGQNALIKAKEEAGLEKEKLDGQNIKDTLKETINNAKEFKKLLIDNDQKIVDLKSNLDNEISKAEQSLSKDKESMESANDLLNTKLIEYKEILNKFNQEKEAKFNELEQTRKNIENFLTDEVKNNPNYATLVKDLTNAKDAKKSVTNSSNKSDIIAANEALIQALADANKAKDQVDEANKSIKEQLNALIDKANTLLPQLNDNDSEIVKAKESLNAEITNANKAVNQNDNASMQSAKSSLDDKVTKIQNQLTEFNKDKEDKFNELEKTRKDINDFLTDDVKNNPNYAALVKDLTNAKDAKKSVTKSSNKSDIIAANDELKQALEKAKTAKEQIDDANKSIKEQLSDSINNANQLLNELIDSDKDIQKAKTELNEKIQSASQALNLNNPTSMQSAKESLDAKIAQVNQQLQQFNQEKDAKFNELEQTRSQIQEFINSNKNNSTYSNIISKLTTTKNEKDSVSKSSNKSDIEDANTLLKNSLKEANDKKQEIDKFVSAKKELEEFIKNDEDAKNDELVSNLNDAKQELAKFSSINDSCEIAEIKKAADDLTTAKAKLEEEIKNKKQELFNAFELSKTTLQNYITNDIKDSKYKIIQDKFNNIIDEYKNITSNDKISKIKDATNNLNAKFTEIGSNKAILDKFYELKPKLEDLLNTANLKDDAKSINIDLSSEDQASTDAKAINNSSTIENVEQVNQKLQAAIDKLTKDIQKINEDKKAKFEEFKTEKQHLEDIIKTKGLDKFINIDDEIKSIKQQIDEEIKKHKINENSKISDILAAKNSIDETQRKLLGSLDNYSTQRTESIESYNNQKTELSSLINSNNNFKQLEESKKTEFNNKKQEYEDLNLETLSKNKIQEKSQEIKELIANINKEISDAKKQEYLNFDKAKKELEKYINDELNNQKYDSIKKEAQNKIDSFSAIKEESLSTKEIQEIKDATNALIKVKTNAEQEKAKIDAKEQLNAKIQEADKLKEKLIDSDSTITTLKTNLEKEIANAKEALKKDTKAIIKAKEQLANKIDEFKSSLDEFNKQKGTKFEELEKTRKDINDFLTNDVKTNPNYADLVKKLQNSLKTQGKISNNSNKADIIAANNELTKALREAKVAKEQADRANSEANNKLTTSLSTADELLKKLTDSDTNIQNYKKQLEKEIENARNAITSKNTKSLTDSNNSLTNKTNEIQEKLNKFIESKNKEFKNFNETKKEIDNFISQIEKDPQTKGNYSNIINKLKNKKAEKNSINENSNKKDIEKANTELQNSLNEAREQKSEIDKFHAAKKALETLISTPDAKKVGTSETQKLLDKSKTINDSTNKETIKNATNELDNAKTNLEQKIKNKKNELLESFKKAKEDLNKYMQNDLQKDEYKAIKENINNELKKIKINQNSKIQEIEDANKSLQKLLSDAKNKKLALDEEIKQQKINEFNRIKNELKTLNSGSDGSEINSNEVKEVLKITVDKSSTIEKIEEETNKLKQAKQELEKLISQKKKEVLEQIKTKKQELKRLFESPDAKKADISNSEKSNISSSLSKEHSESETIHDLKNVLKEINSFIELVNNKINELKQKEKSLAKFNNLRDEFNKLIKEVSEDAEYLKLNKEISDYKQKINAYNSINNNLKSKEIEQKINEIKIDIDGLKSLLKKINEEKDKKNKQINDLKIEILKAKESEFDNVNKFKEKITKFIKEANIDKNNSHLKDFDKIIKELERIDKINKLKSYIVEKIEFPDEYKNKKSDLIKELSNLLETSVWTEKKFEEFDKKVKEIEKNVNSFVERKNKIEKDLETLNVENLGTGGKLSIENINMRVVLQGFINDIQSNFMNNINEANKNESINKINFIYKRIISRYIGILNSTNKLINDSIDHNDSTAKNEIYDELYRNIKDKWITEQIEKMNPDDFDKYYNVYTNGNDSEKGQLEGPKFKWSQFGDQLEIALIRTIEFAFKQKCDETLISKRITQERNGARSLWAYNLEVYSKTHKKNLNDLDLRNKQNLFKGYNVEFQFYDNTPNSWNKKWRGIQYWDGRNPKYRFIGGITVKTTYEYKFTYENGEETTKSVELEYKLDNGNPVIVDKISEIN